MDATTGKTGVTRPSSDGKRNEVSLPDHYQILPDSDVQFIDIARAVMTTEQFIGFCRGNVLKYHLRANWKNRDQDLRKATQYQQWLDEALLDKAREDEQDSKLMEEV